MRQHIRALGLVVTAAALSACGAAHATDTSTSSARATGATTTTAHSTSDRQSAPSASARMTCGPEIRHDVATLLALPAAPRTSTTWAHNVYTCTYHLAQGPLVLSVREAGTVPRARSYFAALRHQLGTTRALHGAAGLGLPAYETTNGNVVFLKDDKTLQVDSTRLPTRVDRSHRSRTDLAYTIATDIMGCWSGD